MIIGATVPLSHGIKVLIKLERSESISADVLVWSPRKSFIFINKIGIFRMKVSQNDVVSFENIITDADVARTGVPAMCDPGKSEVRHSARFSAARSKPPCVGNSMLAQSRLDAPSRDVTFIHEVKKLDPHHMCVVASCCRSVTLCESFQIVPCGAVL